MEARNPQKGRRLVRNRLAFAAMVKHLAKQTRIPQKYVREVLGAAMDLMRQELLAGRKFQLHKVGILFPSIRVARPYLNPQTGEKVKKPARHTIRFKPAKDLKRELNS
jgi:nucleoid DNA-binding protein